MTGMKKVVAWIVSVWAAVKHRVHAPRRSNHTTSVSQVVAVRDNEVSQHPVGQIATIGEQHLGIVDLGTDVSTKLRLLMDENILTRGEPFQSGGMLGSACLPLLGVGSTVSSSLFAGNIFLATANPATLMQIGAGAGSAVMGPGGIVAQAPFIAAGGAMIPVVAPVMFFMTVSSMMMSVRFDQIQASLNQLATAVEQLLMREVAEDYGILLSAMARLRDIGGEFDECRRFTEEMKIRLALVERDVNVLHHKYNVLSTRPVDSVPGAALAVPDMHLFTISSLADLQVDRLRLKLALQDNPNDVSRSFSMLNSKVDRHETSFRALLDKDSVQGYQEQLKESVDGMSWWKRNVFATGERRQKEKDITSTARMRFARIAGQEQSVDNLRLNIAHWSQDLAGRDAGQEQSVVYYRENAGKGNVKAYYTRDLQLEQDVAPNCMRSRSDRRPRRRRPPPRRPSRWPSCLCPTSRRAPRW